MGSLAHERGGLWVTGVSQLDHLFRGLVKIARPTARIATGHPPEAGRGL